MLTIIAISALALVIALHFKVASLRVLILSQANEQKTTAEQDAKARTGLLAALGELHDDIKAERIARGAAEVAARAAERRALRLAAPSISSTGGGGPAEPADDDRKTVTAAPPPGCVAEPPVTETLEGDPTALLSREALAAAIDASKPARAQPPSVRPLATSVREPLPFPELLVGSEDVAEEAVRGGADDSAVHFRFQG